MDHRLFAVLAIVAFALGGAGCASQEQIANREEILMPLQTGSTLQRRVLVEKEGAIKTPKKKKEKKEKVEKEKEKEEKKEKEEPKRPTPKPTPAAVPEPSPEQPVPESTPPPDRFR